MLDKFKFSEIIEKIKIEQNTPYIEIINEYIDEHDIDIDLVPALLTDNLKHRLTKESVELRLVDRAALEDEDEDDSVFGIEMDLLDEVA